MREGEGKFFARILSSFRLAITWPERPASYADDALTPSGLLGGRERERENISCTPPRLALIISGQTKKSIFSECERMEMSNFTRAIYFICRINAITVMIRATLEREFYVLRNNLIYE